MSNGDAAKRELRNLHWLWLSAAVVGLDQLSKQVASHMLDLHQPVAVIPYLNLTLTHNTGAAFSFLSDAGGWQRWFFAGLTVLVAIVIVIWLTRLKPGQRWLAGALSLVLGGALGNLWDRLVIGAVVDFIDVYYQSWHWPAFNLADSAICIGAVMLVVSTFREG
ncbi:MAG TPA: signal peptidase II [Gammaproteobacteria bacterium]|nr:signal peptidase II [Gammaproteobacteria bacterium]